MKKHRIAIKKQLVKQTKVTMQLSVLKRNPLAPVRQEQQVQALLRAEPLAKEIHSQTLLITPKKLNKQALAVIMQIPTSPRYSSVKFAIRLIRLMIS